MAARRLRLLLLSFAGALVVVLTFARDARCEATYISPGLVGSITSKNRLGSGSELSLTHFPHSGLSGGRGAYVRLEWYADLDYKGAADAFGFQASAGPQFVEGPFGLELGLTYRSGIRLDGEGRSMGLRVAPFLSIGILYVGFSAEILPVLVDGRTGLRTPDPVVGFTFGMKVPYRFRGALKANDICPHC